MSERLVAIMSEQVVGIISEYLVGIIGIRNLDADFFTWRCDNDLAGMAALRAGFGIGVCQVAIAARDLSLVPLLETEFRIDLPVWLAMHEELKPAPLMRASFDAIAAGVKHFLQLV